MTLKEKLKKAISKADLKRIISLLDSNPSFVEEVNELKKVIRMDQKKKDNGKKYTDKELNQMNKIEYSTYEIILKKIL